MVGTLGHGGLESRDPSPLLTQSSTFGLILLLQLVTLLFPFSQSDPFTICELKLMLFKQNSIILLDNIFLEKLYYVIIYEEN